MNEREALKLALEALDMFCEHGSILRPIETRDAIKKTLEQPAPEYAVFMDIPHRKPLTWERVLEIGIMCANDHSRLPFEVKVARAVEADHEIK
jgi:hypothetical protein